ncbi:MAG: acyl carrier protein [Conexibacter sp.]|jgi:acyl carrier protein|nr:acyl carrier protein [Conexibacter sp.]MCZ4493988.1 acyl carrier protein [Conexibacter sp.]MDX6714153.1 acyl carrier protein [Baekduia sp.]MDX6732412.1 acyl carrier protein [Baekduia sp.]
MTTTTDQEQNRTMASQQEILEAIRAELTDIKVPDAETAQPDTTWEQLDVDSLDLVELVKALEDRFDVQIADPDLKGIASVGDAITLVERLQGAAA